MKDLLNYVIKGNYSFNSTEEKDTLLENYLETILSYFPEIYSLIERDMLRHLISISMESKEDTYIMQLFNLLLDKLLLIEVATKSTDKRDVYYWLAKEEVSNDTYRIKLAKNLNDIIIQSFKMNIKNLQDSIKNILVSEESNDAKIKKLEDYFLD